MVFSILSFFLAVLGLGVLVFIHELGHYWVARRSGMRVEAFSIGFGKPLITWMHSGVKWQICLLPFGGYVRIAGMQKEGDVEPAQIPDGFFGKSPWKRIQVALAGPVVNILFALFAFTILWLSGGRNKPFAEFTNKIGWVDPKSTLFALGMRPGDVVEKYDNHPIAGFKDLLMASITGGDSAHIEGYKLDYVTGQKSPFNYTLESTRTAKGKLPIIGGLFPASYLIFAGTPLSSGSPIADSGIQLDDRLLWVDGEVVFSQPQLSELTNASTAFLTILRDNRVMHVKVPRAQISDLKMTLPERGEIDDWQHEAQLQGRLQDLYFIPYNLSPTMQVEGHLQFIDEEDLQKAVHQCERCTYFGSLQDGDQILAVDGMRVTTPYQLLTELQTRRILVIVERNLAAVGQIPWTQASAQFDSFSTADLEQIVASIGTDQPVTARGDLHLLKPIVPKPRKSFALSEEHKAQFAQEMARAKKEIEGISDPAKKAEAMQQFEESQSKLMLGLSLRDRQVRYNPNPLEQFGDVVRDTYRTLASLITGAVNPKYVAGPVGIIQVVQQSWLIGFKEALFWMGLISLNLALFNLLPLPILDGGYVLLSLVEMVTRRPLRAKTMEKLIIPFVVLLIGFFIFVTYHDITRLFSALF